MTNNVAEFISLYQLLQHAVSARIQGIHIVGDSAMILNLMRTRRPPRSKKLQHWYRLSRRLADACEVAIWTQHYRSHNKKADLLANLAKDTRSSKQGGDLDAAAIERRYPGHQHFVQNDFAHWQCQDATDNPQSCRPVGMHQ
jgi:ribonuclease HI